MAADLCERLPPPGGPASAGELAGQPPQPEIERLPVCTELTGGRPEPARPEAAPTGTRATIAIGTPIAWPELLASWTATRDQAVEVADAELVLFDVATPNLF